MRRQCASVGWTRLTYLLILACGVRAASDDAAGFLAPTRDDALAFAAVRAGTGSLFFRHVRKAAGSSLLAALEDVASQLVRQNNRSREIYMMHLEFSAFPAACFQVAPSALYVTALREPLSRIHSEFWYSGPAVDNATRYFRRAGIPQTGRGKSAAASRPNNALGTSTGSSQGESTTAARSMAARIWITCSSGPSPAGASRRQTSRASARTET